MEIFVGYIAGFAAMMPLAIIIVWKDYRREGYDHRRESVIDAFMALMLALMLALFWFLTVLVILDERLARPKSNDLSEPDDHIARLGTTFENYPINEYAE